MIIPKCDTNIEIKRKNFETFVELIKEQFETGGKKYAHGDKREATDIICEVYGLEWRLGEMTKRLYRFKNTQHEYDMLKLACEAYLVWLQMGFHLVKDHETDKNIFKTVKISKPKVL